MKLLKKKPILGGIDDTIENARSILPGVAGSLRDDLLDRSFDSFLDQVGLDALIPHKHSGDLEEGQEIDLKKKEQKPEKKVHVEPGIDYHREIIHTERAYAEDSREIKIKIEEVMIEIRKLIESSKELQAEFTEVEMAQVPEKPGKYHLNFVEWLLSMIHQARMRIEDSSAWLSMFKSKKDKRAYWNMFKKHGTSFGLSNERSVATQVG